LFCILLLRGSRGWLAPLGDSLKSLFEQKSGDYIMKLRDSLLFLSLNALPTLLFAQEDADSIRYEFPPVTTTGTRVAESWLEVPLALNVVSLNGAFQGKGYGFDEILSNIPGVLAQSRYGNQDVRLTIRGFGARGAGARSNSGTTRGIRVLVDGFPETEPDGRTSFDLVDLSGAGTVEVVRSNASSIWGNASGGVLNVLSNSNFATPYSSFTSSFGSFGFHKEQVQLGTMLGTGRFFLSVGNTTSDGWRDHSKSSQFLLNTGIVSDLSEQTTLGVYLTGTSNIFRIPGPLTQAQYDSLPEQSDSLFIKRDERRFNRLGRIGVTVSHDLNEGNNLSASAFLNSKYLQRSERNRFRDFTRYHTGGNVTYRNSSAFSSSTRNTLLLGVDEAYQDGAILFYDLTSTGNRGTSTVADKGEGANNFGVFIQDEITFGEQFSALVGARYDDITYNYTDHIMPTLNDTKSFTRVTPKAGLTYRLSPSHSIYANLGGGVEVPAGNEVDPVPTFGTDTVTALNPLLEPITSTTVEVGTKQIITFGENETSAFTYDIALYWLEVQNDIIPYSGGAFYFTAGKTQRKGAELGGNLTFGNGLSFDAAFTFSDNKYGEYIIDSVHYGAPGKFADLKDNKQAGIPDYYYSLAVKFAPRGLGGLFARIGVQGTGEYFADDRNMYVVPSSTILNAGIGIDHHRFSDSGIFVRVFAGVNNLTDQKYVASAWINPDLVNNQPVYLEPGLPRNFVGSVSIGCDL
jgi:iron complex outermembrane receptor protein